MRTAKIFNNNDAAYYACVTTPVGQHFVDLIKSINYVYNLGTLAIFVRPLENNTI
jgi:hypothetical protein